MNRILSPLRLWATVLALFALPVSLAAQTAIATLTTSTAVPKAATAITFSASTGLTANNTYVYIDHELIKIGTQIGTSNRWNVQRGVSDGGDPARSHITGSVVWVLPITSAGQSFVIYDPSGSCTLSDFAFSPLINVKERRFWYCDAVTSGTNQWRRHYGLEAAPNTGLLAQSLTDTTSTISAATQTTEFIVNSVTLPANTFNANSRGISCDAWGTSAANANAKNYKFYFGSTAIVTLTGTTDSGKDYTAHMTVVRTASAAQTGVGSISSDIGAEDAKSVTTSTEADTAAIVVSFKVANTAAAASAATGKGMACTVLN